MATEELQDFMTLKMSKNLALAKKAQFKEKITVRLLKTIDFCKEHGGPLTVSRIDLLPALLEKQLLQ